MAINGKVKGGVAEREVSKMLQSWWSQYEDCQFVKTPASGGWSTANVRSAFKASGDVMTTAQSFPFSVEVKRREGWSESNFMNGRKSPVWAWWHQACTQAHEMNVTPMMLFRRNRKPWWLMIPQTNTAVMNVDPASALVCEFFDVSKHLQANDWYPIVYDAVKFFELVQPTDCLLT